MSQNSNSTSGQGPLAGIRVLEIGQLIAGPFTGCFLGYFGAEVIKVEAPGDGDPIRKWRMLGDDGTSLWWRSLGRNKKCITVNLRTDEGRDIVRKLAAESDVLIENSAPARWNVGALVRKTYRLITRGSFTRVFPATVRRALILKKPVLLQSVRALVAFGI